MPAPVITTAEYPILRVAGRNRLTIETISVADIDTDFEEDTSLTDLVVDGLLTEGFYDDSDGTDYTCQFSTDRPDDVRRQWEALKAEHPELFED